MQQNISRTLILGKVRKEVMRISLSFVCNRLLQLSLRWRHGVTSSVTRSPSHWYSGKRAF